jgi:predicted RND superfamily exporter protein
VLKRFVLATVDASSRRPFLVLALALITVASTWWYASHLEPRSDFLDLLPRDSPGYQAYVHQLGRTGGGASLLVIAESKDRAKNEAFADALAAKLAEYQKGPGEHLISYVETGTKDVRAFFKKNKWLYSEQKDLEDADETLDHQISIRSGMVTDLEGDDDDAPATADAGAAAQAPAPAPAPVAGTAPAPAPAPAPASDAADAGPPVDPDAKQPSLGLTKYFDKWDAKEKKRDDFPTGYFETTDGTMIGIRIVSPSTGTGDRGGDALLVDVGKMVAELNPKSFAPDMEVGFAGDIPNAHEEKESIVSDAALATGFTIVAIWLLIGIFFRSVWSLAVIALPVFIGVGAAYSFAMAAYGYVNTSGMFLGAIILGNGINYPIVLLSRYREFIARGMAPDVARRDAVWNAFRAELVGALVAGIAYGSLTVTRFRGFNQFGTIGFVGMLLVWISMIPVVPAMLVVIDRVQAKLPRWMRDPKSPVHADGSRGLVTRVVARATERFPWVFVAAGLVAVVALGFRLPAFLHDPWEYNFSNLGSRDTKVHGAGLWSTKAEKVFGGKMNIAGAMVLADTPEQVPLIKAQILANDAADPQGQLLAQVSTIDDLLPGTVEQQQKKLAVLDDLRARMSPAVIHGEPEKDRQRLVDMKPPADMKPVTAADLPPLLRRRFTENNGVVGTVFYVKPKNSVSISNGHNALRMAETTDNVKLPDGTIVRTASRWTVYAEMLHSMERDGPLATAVSFAAVVVVVICATSSFQGALAVLGVLVAGVIWALGVAVMFKFPGTTSAFKLNFLNFIALPITFGIGCEYPFNVFDRSRLLGGEVSLAVRRTGGAVALCSLTTTVGYGSLLFSDQQALQSFGRLAMSGEIACLAGALLVLPAILHLMPRWRAQVRRQHPPEPPTAPPEVDAPDTV